MIDFSFIHPLVEGLYSPDNGRPALDPTLTFKALFVGYLFGIRSERQLVREIEVSVAYRQHGKVNVMTLDADEFLRRCHGLLPHAGRGPPSKCGRACFVDGSMLSARGRRQ